MKRLICWLLGGRWTPLPPQEVRMVLEDGTEVVCGVVYDGVDKKYCHLWMAHPIEPVDQSRVVGLQVGVLPARTGVEFTFEIMKEEV